MRDINIYPIFNQATPGIWDDFLRIRAVAMKENYNYKLTDEELVRAMALFRNHWDKLSCSFAFAAYDKDKMVGCLNGYAREKTAYVSHLYVLPKYQGMRIGTQLLRAAEAAMVTNANLVNLVSLGKAYNFYEKMGYISPMHTNEFVKPIKNAGKCHTAPVFFCTKNVANQCQDIMTQNQINDFEFQKNKINQEHLPLFIYRDINQDIKAFGVADKNLRAYGKNKKTNDWATGQAINTVLKYFAHTQNQSK